MAASRPPQSLNASKDNDEDEDDDYLTMILPDPATNSTSKHETLTQRRKRLAREAEARAHPKSKAEIAQEERAKREAALSKSSIDTSSKGYKMMAALGYKPGTALGAAPRSNQHSDGSTTTTAAAATDTRLLEPIVLEMKEGKSGIGADAEKKRKIREAFAAQQSAEKKVKVDEGDFRERQMREREEKRWEAQWWGAMKVAEKLDDEEDEGGNWRQETGIPSGKPLKSVNVFWRPLVKQRVTVDREKRMRSDMNDFLSPTPRSLLPSDRSNHIANDDNTELDPDDRIALGLTVSAAAPTSLNSNSHAVTMVDHLDLDEDDEDLETYIALPAGDRLEKVVSYLRSRWRYCFWCKFRYEDETMEGCPGLTEDDHD